MSKWADLITVPFIMMIIYFIYLGWATAIGMIVTGNDRYVPPGIQWFYDANRRGNVNG